MKFPWPRRREPRPDPERDALLQRQTADIEILLDLLRERDREVLRLQTELARRPFRRGAGGKMEKAV